MEKTIIAGYIEIGCAFTPVIIMAIYGILNKDRDVKHPFMALLIYMLAVGVSACTIMSLNTTIAKGKIVSGKIAIMTMMRTGKFGFMITKPL